MRTTKDAVDVYQNTIARMEPEISHVDRDAALASIAISLKRIADALTDGSRNAAITQAIAEGIGFGADAAIGNWNRNR